MLTPEQRMNAAAANLSWSEVRLLIVLIDDDARAEMASHKIRAAFGTGCGYWSIYVRNVYTNMAPGTFVYLNNSVDLDDPFKNPHEGNVTSRRLSFCSLEISLFSIFTSSTSFWSRLCSFKAASTNPYISILLLNSL